LSLEEYNNNIKDDMIEAALQEVDEVVLISPLPLPVVRELKKGKVLRTAENTEKYARTALYLARARVHICNVYDPMIEAAQHGVNIFRLFENGDCKKNPALVPRSTLICFVQVYIRTQMAIVL
jgi:hypothetical protein